MKMLCLIGIHSYIPYKFHWNKDHQPSAYYDAQIKKAWTGEFYIEEMICQKCGKTKKLIKQ